jgi:hypothetical protein
MKKNLLVQISLALPYLLCAQVSTKNTRAIGFGYYANLAEFTSNTVKNNISNSTTESKLSTTSNMLITFHLLQPIRTQKSEVQLLALGLGYFPSFYKRQSKYVEGNFTSQDITKSTGSTIDATIGILLQKNIQKLTFLYGPQIRYNFFRFNKLYSETSDQTTEPSSVPSNKRVLTGHGPSNHAFSTLVNTITSVPIYNRLHLGFRFQIEFYGKATSGSLLNDIRTYKNDVLISTNILERSYNRTWIFGTSYEPSLMLLYKF